MENVPAVLAIFIREYGWSTMCHSSVKCSHFCVENIVPMSQEEQRPLDAANAAFRRQCKFEGRSFLAAQVPVEMGRSRILGENCRRVRPVR